MKKQTFFQKITIPFFVACALLAACNKKENVQLESEVASQKGLNLSTKSIPANPTYQLVWSDEFNSTGAFNTNNWDYCQRGNVAWNKYMTSTPAYASQDGSNLVLRMDNATILGDPAAYHSGGVKSQGKFSIAFGKIEIRAKFKQGQGSWPAIWMMPEPATAHSPTWPACGEIDIMEHINYLPNVGQTLHNSVVTSPSGGSSAGVVTPYNTTDFNTYAIEWSPAAVKFYVNNTLTNTYSNSTIAGWEQYPYDVPFYIILNQSGGAGMPGPITNSDLPFSMQVDYVRVYKLSEMTNGGFESDSISPWTSWGGTISIVSDNVRTGAKAIKQTGSESSIEQVVTGLSPNTTYTFAGWARVSALGQIASIGVKNYGGSQIGDPVVSTTYSKGSVTFTTGPSNTSATLYFYKPANGTVYGDDFYLEKL